MTGKKKILLGSVSALALGLLCSSVFAQDISNTEDSDDSGYGMETVVVTGIRASLESAQAIKMHADQVVDSITATDIGALPDRNVAEALQRVPGVTLQRTDAADDLTRWGSTGNSVFIRGLSWVKTLVNGRDEFSAVDGRTLSFADVSADLMSGIDVYKSPTAKMIEGGVGGLVNLRTRKPFDQAERVVAISGDYTYGDQVDRALPSVNALYSDRWNTKIGEIGFLVSVDWQDQINRTSGINIGAYDCWDMTQDDTYYDANDDGYSSCTSLDVGDDGHYMAPTGWAWRQMEFKQQRLAANIVLQWRPTEQLELSLSAMNTYAHVTDMEHYVYMSVDQDQVASATFDSKGNWLGGPSSLSSIDTRAGTGHNRNSDINLNVKWNPSDEWEISTDLQFVEASSPYRNVTMYTALTTGLDLDLDVSGNNPKISWTDDGSTTNAGNYVWNAAMDYMRYNVAHAESGRIDATYRAPSPVLGYFKSIDFGFRTEQKLAVTRTTGYNWGALAPNWAWGAYTSWPLLDGTTGCTSGSDCTFTSYNGADPSTVNAYAELFSYQKVFGNSLPSLWLPKSSLAAMNTVASYDLLQAVEPEGAGDLQNYARWISYAANAGCKGADMTCLAAYESTSGNNSTSNRISSQKQATYAWYTQINYEHDSFLGYDIPMDGNLGLRVVYTKNNISDGKLVMPTLNATSCAVGYDFGDGEEVTSCEDFESAVEYLGGVSAAGDTVDRPGVKSHYTNLLPSFNLRLHMSDQLMMRFAYSEQIVRPSFSYTRNNATLSFNWGDSGTYESVLWQKDPTGSGGNPNLKPMHATNYDASVEWYFSATGSLTISLFHKDLSNYVYSATTSTEITNPNSGEVMDFNYTTYVNGDKGKVEGFELAYTQFYDMLPGAFSGVGIQANYTKIYNSGGHNGAVDVTNTTAIDNANNSDLPLEGMSNDSYNIALLYSKYDIDARLAYNWRSRYLSSSSGANVDQPVWMENYGQLDGSIFFSFWDHYKVGLQVTNITDSNAYTDVGYPGYRYRVNWIDTDRKYSFVVRTRW